MLEMTRSTPPLCVVLRAAAGGNRLGEGASAAFRLAAGRVEAGEESQSSGQTSEDGARKK